VELSGGIDGGQWRNRTTDTRIFSAIEINKLLIRLDEEICGKVRKNQAEPES
jgi:hypothetical protein